jgi:hypothetical protein
MWTATAETGGAHAEADIPDLFDAVFATDGTCPEVGRRHINGLGWYCLRDANHKGRHIALGGKGVMAAWPGDHRPRMEDLTD